MNSGQSPTPSKIQVTLQLNFKANPLVLYTSGLVFPQERLLYTLNKLFAKQVKSFLLMLDLDPFIF